MRPKSADGRGFGKRLPAVAATARDLPAVSRQGCQVVEWRPGRRLAHREWVSIGPACELAKIPPGLCRHLDMPDSTTPSVSQLGYHIIERGGLTSRQLRVGRQ